MTNKLKASGENSGSTLSEFLLQAHTQYIIFDLGRGIRPVDNQVFFEWENQQHPCAYPRQGHMWTCIVFWNEKLSQERYIWFIKLPLDENGLLMQATRDAFIEIIINALGKELEHNQDKQAQLPENPYVFTPSQQQLADCNAHIRKHLALPRRDIQAATSYLKAPTLQSNEQQWAHISVQDIADFVIYSVTGSSTTLSTNDAAETQQHRKNQYIIAENLSAYPLPVLSTLFASLESVELIDELQDAIINYHKSILPENTTQAALALRAMSLHPNEACKRYINDLVTNTLKLDMETCVVLAGRYWPLFGNKTLLREYMQKIVELDASHKLFLALYGDLVQVPAIRKYVLEFIREPERSSELANAIGVLFAR